MELKSNAGKNGDWKQIVKASTGKCTCLHIHVIDQEITEKSETDKPYDWARVRIVHSIDGHND